MILFLLYVIVLLAGAVGVLTVLGMLLWFIANVFLAIAEVLR